MQSRSLRIGTRGSPLALFQAHETRERLMHAHGFKADDIEISVIKTSGDRIQDRALALAGGKGLFTKEIEEALLEGSIDLAVHSSKDMPTVLPDGLILSAFLPREDVRDALISKNGLALADLPQGAIIGSASLRRQALIRLLRPDLKVVLFRGNVQTRLNKIEHGEADATLLALAGLRRLGLTHTIAEVLSIENFPPAIGQGAICIESRANDPRTLALLSALDHAPTRLALTVERAFLHALDGSCRTPIAGYAQLINEQIQFRGLILRTDGSQYFETTRQGAPQDAAKLGHDAGMELKERAPHNFFVPLEHAFPSKNED